MIPAITPTQGRESSINNNARAMPLIKHRDILRDTHIDTLGPVNIRRMGNLSWIENTNIASLAARLEFIHQLTSHIVENIPVKNTPLTLISVGSGGLLTERYIEQQLKKSGYQDISWRMIDLDYQQDGFRDSRKEFRESINKNTLAFTTEQAYLNKTNGHSLQAIEDRNHSASIILAIDPPSALDGQAALEQATMSDCMMIRGRPVDDIKKANCIYLLASQKEYQPSLHLVQQALAEGNQMIMLSCVLKCILDQHNDCKVTFSPSSTGQLLNQDSRPFLDSVHRIAEQSGQKLELPHLDKALGKYLTSLDNVGMAGTKFFVSDYDTSLIQLQQHFQAGNNATLFAAFEHNQTRFQI